MVVAKSRALRHALLGALFLSPDDQRNLAEATGPTRVGVGVVGADGMHYRVLRELAQGRTLHKLDPVQKKFTQVTSDDLEIDSFLRVECGLPQGDGFSGFFVLDAAELPSQRGKPVAQGSVDQVKVKALRDELAQTQRFEGLQDRLFNQQQRLLELDALAAKVKEGEEELADLDAELARAPFTPEQMKQLSEKAASAKGDQRKRDEALSEIATQRQRLARSMPPTPDPLLKDPLFGGGLAGGLLLDALAVYLRKPPVALAGLLPFGATLIASLRWIAADEADVHAASESKRLKEREDHLRKVFADDQAQLKSAMSSANVDSPGDLLEVFKQREAVMAKREAARMRLVELKKNPELARIPIETPLLVSEKQKLEAEVLQQGFARPLGEIEIDLKVALGLAATSKVSAAGDADLPKDLVDRAADVLQLSPEELWRQIVPRFGAYLAALTDKRIVSGKPDAKGQLLLSAADGRGGPFQGLPQPLKDLAYLALRLSLIEKVAGYKRLPVIVDDAFGVLEPAKRVLTHKMLKAISGLTQVIHRTPEAPPEGVADVVVQAP
ncbi:MAG: hypothetical protein NVSMB23_28350 [Myxococcales bacterium]